MNKFKKFNKKHIVITSMILAILIVIIIMMKLLVKPINEKTYTDFLKDINDKKISTVYLTTAPKIKVKLKNNEVYETSNPRSNDFKESLLSDGIYVSEGSILSTSELAPIITFVIIFAVIVFLIFKSGKISPKGMLSVDFMEAATVSEIGCNFESVAGNEEAKESVKDIVDFLKNPEVYSKYGARMPKGIILYGEPGTGKTLMAKAVAGEAGVPFYAMSGSDFVQVYVGVGASRIRQLFKKARSHGKAVIFIDEIDAIGKKRQSKSGGSEERDQTLNALLTEMSGFNEKEGIVVMAATNRLDMLDSALLRPGRFDRHIEVTLPDVSAREKILKLHLVNKPTKEIDFKDWASKTSYFSGAKIESLINEAAIIACKTKSDFIENTHIEKAFSIVLAGYEKVNRDYIKDNDKKITAYHEAGHALVSLRVLPKEKVSKVTIIPSTKGAGGYTLSIPEDNMYQTKDYLRRRIMVLLGGRAAEEIIFGKDKITTGAYSDIENSTSIITKMVTQYGMGRTLGLLNLSELNNINYNPAQDIMLECKETVDNLYAEAKELLLKDREVLEKIVEELLNKETIFEDRMLEIANQ